jgi:large subunit ribosomal protein L24
MKPSQKHPNGGIVEKEGSVALSSVRIVCPKCDAPRRTKAEFRGEDKLRVCAKCGETIEAAA